MAHPLKQRMMQVILDKGIKGRKVFDPEKENDAYRRATALSELHGRCRITEEDDYIIRVHAAYWYK